MNGSSLIISNKMADISRTPQQALEVLNRAALAIAAEVSLEKVLQQITDSARELVGARFAALGVPDTDGNLEKFVTSGISIAEAKSIPHLPEGSGLLGSIMHERRTIRLPNIQEDPGCSRRGHNFYPGRQAILVA